MTRRDRRRHTAAVHVDGQNAIHSLGLDDGAGLPGPRGAGRRSGSRERIDALRRHLLEIVAASAHGGHGRITVHFDGHPASGAFGRTRVGDVFVMFSEDREADEDIADAVRHAARPGSILVVTDDLELSRRLDSMGARSARVTEFFRPRAARREEPAAACEEGSLAGGFTPSDFGLPDTVNLDAPPGELRPRSVRAPRDPPSK